MTVPGDVKKWSISVTVIWVIVDIYNSGIYGIFDFY